MRHNLPQPALVAAGLLTAGAALWYIDPARASLVPPCPLHRLTGLYCPGCGSTRALHSLLHGDVAGALAMNALCVALIPLLAYVLCLRVVAGLTGRPVRPVRFPRWMRWGVLITAVAFAIARNLPVYPLALLAPR